MDVINYSKIKKVKAELDEHKEEYGLQRQQDQLKVLNVEKELKDYQRTLAQVNVNHEAKQSASGYGTISLPPNAANGQVSVSVKGRTLKNELNYNIETYEEWIFGNTPSSVKNSNGIHFVDVGTGMSEAVYLQTKFKPNTKYGLIMDITDVARVGTVGLMIAPNLTGSNITIGNTKGIKKISFTTQANISRNELNFFIGGVYEGESYFDFKNIRVFELPVGSEIETDFTNLTADQLALKYPYISGGTAKSTISAMRLKSVGKNLVSKDKIMQSSIAWNTGKISGGGFRTDYIRIKPNTMYTQNKRALFTTRGVAFYDENKKYLSGRKTSGKDLNAPLSFTTPNGAYYLRTSFEIKDNFQLEESTVATEYEPYKESTAYITAKKDNKIVNLRSLPNGTKDEISLSEKKAIIKIGTKTDVVSGTVINYTDMADGGQFVAYYEDGTQQVGIKGDTLTAIATTLTYQLAEPEIIPIEVSGNIVAHPNGTVYIEHGTFTAGVYGVNGIAVTNTGLPIKTINKITKIDYTTGLEYDLDISQAVISEDKLLFTHPDLTVGDIVFFDYGYDVESTEGLATVEFYDSRYVIEDKSIAGKYYTWKVEVDNGVPSITVVEV